MAKHPVLGTNCPLDFDRLIETRLLVQANSGAGKSWLIRRFTEQVFGLAPVIIIDHDGEYHTLREQFDFVLAGRNGDCAADIQSAALLAHKLLQLRASAIVDIYELGTQRAEFVKRFLNALVNAPRDLWGPTVIVIDEVHFYCPEVGSAVSADAVKNLMALGRKRGFCGVLATQRIAKLHKDAAAEANNKLIGRSALDIDMKRAASEIGFTSREDIQSLRTLKSGEFYAFGPALSDIVKLTKIGDVKTTHLRAGERASLPVAPRKTILKVLSQLADLPQEAQEEARTSVEWKAKAKQLEAELKKALAAQPATKIETKIVEKALITEAQLKRLEALFKKADAFHQSADVIRGSLHEYREAVRLITRQPSPAVGHTSVHGSRAARPAPLNIDRPPRPQAREHDLDEKGPSKAELKILGALAWTESIGQPEASSTAVAFIAGYTENGHFNNMKGRLKSAELIDYPSGGMMKLLPAGREIAPPPDVAQTLAGLHDAVRARLKKGALAKLLEPLLLAYPESLDLESLAEQAGFTVNGHFSNMRGKLRTLGLVTYSGKGMTRAADILFPSELSQ